MKLDPENPMDMTSSPVLEFCLVWVVIYHHWIWSAHNNGWYEYLYSMVIFRFPSLFIKATFIFVMLTLLAILKTFHFWIVLWHWFIESLDQLSRSKWFEYWIEQGRCIEFQLYIYLQNLHLFRFPTVLWTEQTHLAVR